MLVANFEIDTAASLGTGGFGQVFRARDTATGEVVAAKVLDSKRVRREKIMMEIKLMELVSAHRSFVGLRGAHEVAEHRKIFIFMELATGGELFERVIKNGKLEEGEAVRAGEGGVDETGERLFCANRVSWPQCPDDP